MSFVAMALVALLSTTAEAQTAATVIGNATKAMGAENVNSVTYYGSAANFNLGQSNNANGPWPRVNVNDYRRSIDFTQPISRASGVTFAAPVQGGPAVQGVFNQNIAPAQNNVWAQSLEIWITPWGFLKGAAANNATVRTQTIGGQRYNIVTWMTPQKAPSGASYRVVGYINAQNLVERVETQLENPIFGDMPVEARYSIYREAANGFKFPSTIVQLRAGSPTFEAQILGAVANPSDIQALVTPPPPPAGRGGGPGGPGAPGGAPAAVVSQSEKLADGVYRIFGGYNALAVEFADHIFLFEAGPQNEARALANIAEVKRVIPNKPIRYGALSHHHFDHTSGLPAAVAEGITIVVHENNKAFFEKALAAPRTLAPDAMSKAGKKAVIEGMGDKRVFSDATRTLELHHIKGLPHADGMIVGYLPKEKVLIYADTYNAPPAGMTAPRIVAVEVMVDNLERLKLDYERVISVHAPNPDRPITRTEILASLGR
jgi:glyoxylase-like metal-dependent hydrolase (beta-lactamase superfamily II)